MSKNPKCKFCQYRAGVQDANGCDYYLITGQRRGCSVEDCDRGIEGPKITLKGKMKAEIAPGYLRGCYKVRRGESNERRTSKETQEE